MREGVIYKILNTTAWRMDAPRLFSIFHFAASLATAVLAVAAAVLICKYVTGCGRRRAADGPGDLSHDANGLSGQRVYDTCRENRLVSVLAVTGWVLVALEIYKQLFLFFVVNDTVYDWWYFPFQLCSVPMYLCVLLPLVGERARGTYLTFMSGYTLISALATLIYPEDILRSYMSLTLHGFIWHGILLFISLLIIMHGAADASARGIIRAGGLFAALCVIAVIINMAAEPAMQAASAAHAIPHSYAAMFYMNPYHLSDQPIVSSVQKAAGIPAGLLLYALTIAATGSLVSLLTSERSLHK